MAIATGVGKRLAAKVESSFGVAAGAASAQVLRRVQSTLNMAKNMNESAEINSTYMVSDYRPGTRRIEGNINGELSGGTYQMFIEAALRRAATAVSNITGLTLDVDPSGSLFAIERLAGSWITDGIRVGMVVRATAGLNAGSLNRNLLVASLTATIMTVLVLDSGAALTTESGVAACTITVPGKYTYVPTTGHIDRSFTIEEWHSDIANLSRLFTGCKVNTMGFRLPASGMSMLEMAFLGKDMTIAETAYFTTPADPTTSIVATAVNGAIMLGTTRLALITGMNVDVNGGYTVGEVVGSNTTPDVFEGRARVSGQMTMYLEDKTYLEAFVNDTELSAHLALLDSESGNANFQALSMPRIKFGGATPDDGEKGLVLTLPFTALRKGTVTGFNDTVIQYHDSLFA